MESVATPHLVVSWYLDPPFAIPNESTGTYEKLIDSNTITVTIRGDRHLVSRALGKNFKDRVNRIHEEMK